MKLRRGRSRYRMPAYSYIEHVRIEGYQRHNQMHLITLSLIGVEQLSAKPLL